MTVEAGFAHYVPNSPHAWALYLKTQNDDNKTWAFKNLKWWFKTSTDNGAIGTKLEYNPADGTTTTEASLQYKMDGYKWLFRFGNAGLLRAAVQSQIHKNCKATLNTNVDVKKFLEGKVDKAPLGLSVELKY